jgi:hypothetical protein
MHGNLNTNTISKTNANINNTTPTFSSEFLTSLSSTAAAAAAFAKQQHQSQHQTQRGKSTAETGAGGAIDKYVQVNNGAASLLNDFLQSRPSYSQGTEMSASSSLTPPSQSQSQSQPQSQPQPQPSSLLSSLSSSHDSQTSVNASTNASGSSARSKTNTYYSNLLASLFKTVSGANTSNISNIPTAAHPGAVGTAQQHTNAALSSYYASLFAPNPTRNGNSKNNNNINNNNNNDLDSGTNILVNPYMPQRVHSQSHSYNSSSSSSSNHRSGLNAFNSNFGAESSVSFGGQPVPVYSPRQLRSSGAIHAQMQSIYGNSGAGSLGIAGRKSRKNKKKTKSSTSTTPASYSVLSSLSATAPSPRSFLLLQQQQQQQQQQPSVVQQQQMQQGIDSMMGPSRSYGFVQSPGLHSIQPQTHYANEYDALNPYTSSSASTSTNFQRHQQMPSTFHAAATVSSGYAPIASEKCTNSNINSNNIINNNSNKQIPIPASTPFDSNDERLELLLRKRAQSRS